MPDPSILDCNTVMCNTILIAAILPSPDPDDWTGGCSEVALASRCPAPLPWLPAATTVEVETPCLGPLTAELGRVSRGECPHCCSAAVLQAPALFRDQEVTPGAGAVVCGEQVPRCSGDSGDRAVSAGPPSPLPSCQDPAPA